MLRTTLITVLLLAVLAAAAAFGLGPWLADRQAEQSLQGLLASSGQLTRQPGWEFRVPASVKGWLSQALPASGPLASLAMLRQKGGFRAGPQKPWLKFTAREGLAARPPGFVWSARLRLAPGLYLTSLDRLFGGHGSVSGRLAGLLPWFGGDGPEADLSNLTRWAAEAVWLPGALLPKSGLSWRAGPVEASAVINLDLSGPAGAGLGINGVFYFGPDGLPTRFVSNDRWKSDGKGGYHKQPWQVLYSHYKRLSGHLVPTRAEVAWLKPAGTSLYARVELTSIEYR